MKKISILTILFTLLTTLSWADDVTVLVGMRENSFTIGQREVLQLEIRGSRSAEVILPDIENITFQEAGSNQSIQIVNGSYSATLIKNYVITASKVGSYTIPKFEVKVDDESYLSKPLNFTVVEDKTAQSKDQNGNEIAFMEVKVAPSAYPGEKLELSIEAYFNDKYNIKLAQNFPQLAGNDLSLASSGIQPKQTRQQVGSAIYNKIQWHMSLSALKPGTYPLDISLPAVIITQDRRSNRFNDPFFSSMFQNSKQESFTLKNDKQNITIKSLPEENMPENFMGAIGKFDMLVTADPLEVEIGQPVTLINTITGTGNFENVSAPKMADNDEWKVYPANVISDPKDTNQKVFEQVIIAKKNSTTVPSFSFSYFDLDKEEYVNLESAPIKIKVTSVVEPEVKQEPVKIKVKEEVQKEDTKKDNMLKQYASSTVPQEKLEPIFMKTWFQAIILLCFLAIIALFAYYFFIYLKNRNPLQKQEKERLKLLASQLEDIKKLSSDDDKILQLKKCIQQQLAMLWNVEAEAISGSTIKTKLPESALVEIMKNVDEYQLVGKPITSQETDKYLQQIKEELG